MFPSLYGGRLLIIVIVGKCMRDLRRKVWCPHSDAISLSGCGQEALNSAGVWRGLASVTEVITTDAHATTATEVFPSWRWWRRACANLRWILSLCWYSCNMLSLTAVYIRALSDWLLEWFRGWRTDYILEDWLLLSGEALLLVVHSTLFSLSSFVFPFELLCCR